MYFAKFTLGKTTWTVVRSNRVDCLTACYKRVSAYYGYGQESIDFFANQFGTIYTPIQCA